MTTVKIIVKPCPVTLPRGKLAGRIKPVAYIAVHCSATRPSLDIGIAELNTMHLQRGFACVGYHYAIRRDGTVEKGRPDTCIGAHVEGYNSVSLGICMIGGIGNDGKAVANFTDAQYKSLQALVTQLKLEHPPAVVQGHRDFSPDLNHDGVIAKNEWIKECPCFDVKPWWANRK